MAANPIWMQLLQTLNTSKSWLADGVTQDGSPLGRYDGAFARKLPPAVIEPVG